jgi:uncharacterized surface protein with fasciclin (FAS1) repeats
MNNRKSFVISLVLVTVLGLAALLPSTAFAKPERTTIVDVVISNPDVDGDGEGDFDILLAAVLNADPAIAEALSGMGQYTVFAPTDAAFVALLGELGLSAADVLGNSELLTQVLLYHVARGERDSADVIGSDRIRTMQGGFLFQDGGVLTDNNGRTSNIILVDIETDNGIIHVINTVVLP